MKCVFQNKKKVFQKKKIWSAVYSKDYKKQKKLKIDNIIQISVFGSQARDIEFQTKSLLAQQSGLPISSTSFTTLLFSIQMITWIYLDHQGV